MARSVTSWAWKTTGFEEKGQTDLPSRCAKLRTCAFSTAAVTTIVSIDTPGVPFTVRDYIPFVFDRELSRAKAKQLVRWIHGTHHTVRSHYGLQRGILGDGIAADAGYYWDVSPTILTS